MRRAKEIAKTLDKLDEYCKTTYVPKTKVVEVALNEYLDKMEKINPLFKEQLQSGCLRRILKKEKIKT